MLEGAGYQVRIRERVIVKHPLRRWIVPDLLCVDRDTPPIIGENWASNQVRLILEISRPSGWSRNLLKIWAYKEILDVPIGLAIYMDPIRRDSRELITAFCRAHNLSLVRLIKGAGSFEMIIPFGVLLLR